MIKLDRISVLAKMGYGSAIIEKSPTSTGTLISEWVNPTEAFVSDNVYSAGGVDNAQQDYGDFGFDLFGSIDKVIVKLEHVEVGGFWQIYLYVSWDGGSTWSDPHEVPIALTERVDEIDVTGDTDWTAEKLSDANFKVLVFANRVGTGCYHIDSELMTFEGVLKKIRACKSGDLVLGWDIDKARFVKAKVKRVVVHKRETPLKPFQLRRIVCKIPEYEKGGYVDIAVTLDHKVWERRRGLIPAKDVKEGDFLSGLFKAEWGWKLEPCRVVRLEDFQTRECVNIETDADLIFYHFALEVVIK